MRSQILKPGNGDSCRTFNVVFITGLLLFFTFFLGCSSLDQRQAGGGDC